jgi:UDP-N-acetylglucosamine 1-carboxyvinyltransferase
MIITKSQLKGSVAVSGAKNSVLRLLAASLLTDSSITLSNYPAGLLDAQVHVDMLRALGKQCEVTGDRIRISENSGLRQRLNWDGRSIRNTLLILGALLARTGSGAVPLPGGCKLGERKYDLHVQVFESMGARVWEEDGFLCAESKGRLKGADIHLRIRSTGATENAILCGCLADGTTRIWNPHIRPEIVDLTQTLNQMGAKIRVFGQEHIEITGVEGLGGIDKQVMSDNVEALTWLIGSVITGGDVEIQGFPFKDLEIPMIHLRESGARFFANEDSLIVRGGKPYPIDISTGPYPGINSDMQPLFAVYGAVARGESRIVDLRFPGRYGYADELRKMGVLSSTHDNLLVIEGGKPLVGTTVRALDLRAGIALLLAGMVADGETLIEDAWQIGRGYDQLSAKLRDLQANYSVSDIISE